MPYLVKGGKWVYGWVRIGEIVTIPSDALSDYKIVKNEPVIFMNGSKHSGGLVIVPIRILLKTRLKIILDQNPNLRKSGAFVHDLKSGRSYLSGEIFGSHQIKMTGEMISSFGLEHYDRLLAVRGSSTGITMIVKGTIVEEAKKHPELEWF